MTSARRLRKHWWGVLFSGVFPDRRSVPDENPWIGPAWADLSQRKLRAIPPAAVPVDGVPAAPTLGYPAVTSLVINLMSQDRPCRVVDFGGGTGYECFRLLPSLSRPENVSFHVFDSNRALFDLGQAFGKTVPHGDRVFFHPDSFDGWEGPIDILHINTALQYLPDPIADLAGLLRRGPQCVVLTRLLAGEIPTFTTCQNVLGVRTPCTFLNVRDLVAGCAAAGYRVAFQAPCLEEDLTGDFAPDIPASHRIPHSLTLVLHPMAAAQACASATASDQGL